MDGFEGQTCTWRVFHSVLSCDSSNKIDITSHYLQLHGIKVRCRAVPPSSGNDVTSDDEDQRMCPVSSSPFLTSSILSLSHPQWNKWRHGCEGKHELSCALRLCSPAWSDCTSARQINCICDVMFVLAWCSDRSPPPHTHTPAPLSWITAMLLDRSSHRWSHSLSAHTSSSCLSLIWWSSPEKRGWQSAHSFCLHVDNARYV